MRVLLSCLQSTIRHQIPAYDFWRSYFINGFAEARVECVEVPNVDWALGIVVPEGVDLAHWRDRVWSATLEFAKLEHQRRPIDLFLSYLYPRQVEASAIAQLQSLGVPCVNFFCDNVREFKSAPLEYAPFDLHWVPEFEALPLYRHAGLPHLLSAMPCWVEPKYSALPVVETEPATFIGSADILRRDLLGRAIHAGAELVVRGPGWSSDNSGGKDVSKPPSGVAVFSRQVDVMKRRGGGALFRKVINRLLPFDSPALDSTIIRPAVWQDEYFRISRESVVCVGVNRVPSWKALNRRPLKYSRLRDIEAPMLGACYLTEWTEGLEMLFDLGEEIESYRSPEELAEKLLVLKRDPARRRDMRSRAQRRALSEHTVPRTLEKISARLGLRQRR